MFKVGDRVVPISKSLGKCLDESKFWNRAKEIGQKYLYIVHIYVDGDISCNGNGENGGGDLYRAEDLIPYVEEVKEQRTHKFTMKEIIKLHEVGIIKETDEFYITRA